MKMTGMMVRRNEGKTWNIVAECGLYYIAKTKEGTGRMFAKKSYESIEQYPIEIPSCRCCPEIVEAYRYCGIV